MMFLDEKQIALGAKPVFSSLLLIQGLIQGIIVNGSLTVRPPLTEKL